MISAFVREQKRYTLHELCNILGSSEDKAIPVIRMLKEYGILKAVSENEKQRNMSDLLDEDIEVADVEPGSNSYYYVFTFVGVVVAAGIVLKCYPKYLLHADQPVKELAQILKVLEKYNSREQIVYMFNDSSEGSSFNLLAVLLFLLQDYYENGVYNNTNDIIENNGNGEILWDKTINDTFAIMSQNRPYYVELKTKRRINNEYDYFKRLHECVLTKASRELEDAGLLDLFEITGADISDEELEDFGDTEYILNNIEKELNVQFNTRKQLVLKTLYAYLAHNGSLYDTTGLSLYGTNSFNLVWEKLCADIMDNQLDVSLGRLNLPIPLKPQYDKRAKLKDLIEKPVWSATGKTAEETLIPDIISIAKINQKYEFIIFDAKYYNARLESGLVPKGQPGIESVTKQYLYQLAYQEFINDHNFDGVINCFLMPTEEKNVINKGDVSLKMLSGLGLQNIKVRIVPAQTVYEYYLSGKKMDIAALDI